MRYLLLQSMALFVAGCASLPDNSGLWESHALSGPRGSLISKDFYAAPESGEGKSAFLLLSDDLDAFVARAVLTQEAATGIDLQYYMIHGDHVGKLLVGQLLKAAERGVRVRILTNSLASTDVTIVHAGYARYRKALLRAGVELWELDETMSKEERKAIKKGYLGKSKSSLHAKAFVVDRKTVFIGSLNLDPRSVIQNTEIGVVFESPAIGRHIAEKFDANIDKDAFRLELVEDKEGGRSWIVWHGYRDGQPVTWDTEPNTGFWRRFGVGFLRIMPIESQI